MKRLIHPNSLKNLKPRRKGDRTINPSGRPRSAVFREQVLDFLREPLDGVKDRTRLDALLARLEQDKPEILLHYAFGKPTEQVELTSTNGLPLIPDNLIQAAVIVAQNL